MTALTALAALTIGQAAAPAAPVELLRTFKAGETLKYQVRSLLVTETKQLGAPYFQPSDMEFNYDSTVEVKGVKNDGFADLIYRRPTITIIEGEDAEGDRKTVKQNVNFNLSLTVSPINEVTNVKELPAPAKAPARKPTGRPRSVAPWLASAAVSQPGMNIEFVGELYRLALFVGSLDNSLDLAPKLPFEEVKVGDTWKRTASYQPQALKGGKGKMAVQRLDWTYRYDGLITEGGRTFHRITGTLALDTDAAAFINQAMGATPSQSGLEKLPLKLDSTVAFDLDPKTLVTLRAGATTKGAWSLKSTQMTQNIVEEKITGRTTLTLVR